MCNEWLNGKVRTIRYKSERKMMNTDECWANRVGHLKLQICD